MIYPSRALLSLQVITDEHRPMRCCDETGNRTFSLSRMWKKARRSVGSFPVDLYNGGKVRFPFVCGSDIVKQKAVRRWRDVDD
jgi:hypothetical protein